MINYFPEDENRQKLFSIDFCIYFELFLNANHFNAIVRLKKSLDCQTKQSLDILLGKKVILGISYLKILKIKMIAGFKLHILLKEAVCLGICFGRKNDFCFPDILTTDGRTVRTTVGNAGTSATERRRGARAFHVSGSEENGIKSVNTKDLKLL